MSSQWLPQNLQKRLLLYVLQQLSVFSEINLPNLETVSLNTIQLKDVSLDPEKAGKLPGCNLRYGQIGALELSGGLMGGVNIDASDIDLVLSLALDVNEDLVKSVNLLVQTTADLANSIILDDGLDDSLQGLDDKSQKESSKLGVVMAKALELALLRLQITLHHINIKVVLDLTDLLITVDKIVVNSVNGVRNVSFDGTSVFVLKPDVNSGDKGDDSDDSDKSDGSSQCSESESDDSESDENNQSLLDSMVFTHEQASSIYMSATSQSFAPKHDTSKEPLIATIDKLELEFAGLMPISDLTVTMGKVILSTNPLMPTILSIINGITRSLKLKTHHRRKHNLTRQLPVTDDDPQTNSESQLFNKFHISNVIISLTSAINEGGLINTKNNLYINLYNVTLKQKNNDLIYGGIEKFQVIQTIEGSSTPIIYFDDSGDGKADVRFEIFDKISVEFTGREHTLLLSKTFKLELNVQIIAEMLKLQNWLNMLNNNMTNLFNAMDMYRNPPSMNRKVDTQIIVQSSNLELAIDLNSMALKFDVSPISFNLLNNGLKCAKIVIGLFDKVYTKIGTISNITTTLKLQAFKGYTTSNTYYSKAVNMNSAMNFKINSIDIDIEYAKLKLVLRLVNNVTAQVQTILKPFIELPVKGSIQASIYLAKRRNHQALNQTNCGFHLQIDSINVQIKDVANFGDIINNIQNVHIYQLDRSIYFIVKDIIINRFQSKLEKILYNYSKTHEPLIIGIINITKEIKFNNLVVEYYTYWQDFTSNNDKQARADVPDAAVMNLDIRLEFINCLIGITPYQLPCKAMILLNKMTSDIMMNETIYVKSTIRDLNLLLIDDTDNIVTSIHHRHNTVDLLTSQGYLVIGNINNLHIGITINTNELELIKRNQTFNNPYNKLSLGDIKVNIDEINLETCGDSFHTFIQLLNDSKIPLVLDDKDKFKIEVKNEINVMEGITDFNEEFSVNSLKVFPITQSNDTLFDIIEDYKDIDANIEDSDVTGASVINDTDVLQLDDNYFNKMMKNKSMRVNPISVNVNIGKFKLYMYDGYDWKQTRKVIRGVVKRVEQSGDLEGNDEDDIEIIEETLFKSIHVRFPKGTNPNDLTTNINKQVNEVNETNSETSGGYKDLKLKRSHKYKMVIEAENIDINVTILSLRDPITEPIEVEYEVINEIELIVDLITIHDNLMSSSWNKYLSYMSSSGEKEVGKNMLKLNIITTRSPSNLNFNETVAKLNILPLRLFIDQDTNEFLVRFFQFTDTRFNLPKIDEEVYFQRFEINNDLKIKIDYKPKKLNLTGLKNGEFNQLLNLINISGLTITLNAIKLYGIKGMEGLFTQLFTNWLPHIQNTQLMQLISGIGLFQPFINISESFKNIIQVPLNDTNYYQKLNRHGQNFLKTTSFELLKLGYKVTNGTQNLLEQGEEILGGVGSKSRRYQPSKPFRTNDVTDTEIDLLVNSKKLTKSIHIDANNIYNSSHIKKYSEMEDPDPESSEDEDIEDAKLVSLYANQPQNFKQGIEYSFKSISKNYNITRNEFIKLIEKFNELDNYEESLKILLKKSPLLVLRPLIGTTEVVSKALMGLSNEISSVDQIESRDKYQ